MAIRSEGYSSRVIDWNRRLSAVGDEESVTISSPTWHTWIGSSLIGNSVSLDSGIKSFLSAPLAIRSFPVKTRKKEEKKMISIIAKWQWWKPNKKKCCIQINLSLIHVHANKGIMNRVEGNRLVSYFKTASCRAQVFNDQVELKSMNNVECCLWVNDSQSVNIVFCCLPTREYGSKDWNKTGTDENTCSILD